MNERGELTLTDFATGAWRFRVLDGTRSRDCSFRVLEATPTRVCVSLGPK